MKKLSLLVVGLGLFVANNSFAQGSVIGAPNGGVIDNNDNSSGYTFTSRVLKTIDEPKQILQIEIVIKYAGKVFCSKNVPMQVDGTPFSEDCGGKSLRAKLYKGSWTNKYYNKVNLGETDDDSKLINDQEVTINWKPKSSGNSSGYSSATAKSFSL